MANDRLARIPNQDKPKQATTKFKDFSPYENGRVRFLKYNINALADFEQETGMGFAELLSKRAVFAAARALVWAGLKHEDRALSIEAVGDLIGEYLKDESVPQGSHTVDTILQSALAAAVEQGALGRMKKEELVIEEPGPNEEAGDDEAGPVVN